jgi:non-homologous end joining protein Ku
MSTKERVVLIHHYRDAIVATALRYPDEMKDLFHMPQQEDLQSLAKRSWTWP